MAKSPIFQVDALSQASGPDRFEERVDQDRILNDLRDKLDLWAGKVTGSFCSKFERSGSAASLLADTAQIFGSEYAREDRLVTEVVCFAARSGSGGVTRFDVQVQQVPGATNFASLFSNNVFKPALSSSLGNYGVAKASTFTSGTTSPWRKGTVLKVVLDTAAGEANMLDGQDGLVCQVFWKPSGSYGA
jgi:hypothetical protein